jgi:hypothetical protein
MTGRDTARNASGRLDADRGPPDTRRSAGPPEIRPALVPLAGAAPKSMDAGTVRVELL